MQFLINKKVLILKEWLELLTLYDLINISVISEIEASSSQRLLILFEDSSEKMVLKQQAVQNQNEPSFF